MIFAALLALFAGLGFAGLVAAYRLWWRQSHRNPPRLVDEASVGTLTWLDRSDAGRLDQLTTYEFQAQVLGRLGDVPLEIATRYLGLRWERNVPDDVTHPTTPFADAVRARCEAMPVPWLVNHSKRTYELAYLYGRKRSFEFDPEVLYAAALLHDVGLAERSDPATAPTVAEGCFTITSAIVAGRIAEQHGWSPGRIARMCEAITLHLNPNVDRFKGVEAWLLAFATGLDIAGVGFGKLHSPAMAGIYDRIPLLDQPDKIMPLWHDEAQREPRCRVAALDDLWLSHLVDTSPVYRTR